MVREGERKSDRDANELLNFRFSSSPPSPQLSRVAEAGARRSSTSRYHRSNNSNPSHYNSSQQRNRHDRVGSSTKKQSLPFGTPKSFFLHSSADHAFVISRIPPKQQQSYSFNGPDSLVSWDSVRMVKYLSNKDYTSRRGRAGAAPATTTTTGTVTDDEIVASEHCPICLDELLCPRITKCGHFFCLTCLIHHVQTTTHCPPQCPCCAIELDPMLGDVRPMQIITVTATYTTHRAAVPQTITEKLQSNRQQGFSSSSPTAAVAVTFRKLHRAKGCAAPYLPILSSPRRSSPQAIPCQTDPDAAYCKYNYVDPFLLQGFLEYNLQELTQAGAMTGPNDDPCRCLAMQMVRRELDQARAEQADEMDLIERFRNPAAGIYQDHPPPLLYHPSYHPDDEFGLERHHPRPRHESITSESSIPSMEGGQEGKSNEQDGMSKDKQNLKRSTKLDATMFLDTDETVFYQAEDGSLCFLSSFNMNCLRHEFSTTRPENTGQMIGARRYMPLPDIINGQVVDVERVHLTPQIRSRLRFLSHLPPHSDICLVEVSLGGILSSSTKQFFQKEFQKRKQVRQRRWEAEKRVDERIRQQEQQLIEDRKQRMQIIDPDDEFFRPPAIAVPLPTSEEFGPSLVSSSPSRSGGIVDSHGGVVPVFATSSTNKHLTQSFSEVTRHGNNPLTLNHFPSLGESRNIVHHAASTSKPRSSWGKPSVPAKQLDEAEHHHVAATSVTKKKGKKVLLFSTGGHRYGMP